MHKNNAINMRNLTSGLYKHTIPYVAKDERRLGALTL